MVPVASVAQITNDIQTTTVTAIDMWLITTPRATPNTTATASANISTRIDISTEITENRVMNVIAGSIISMPNTANIPNTGTISALDSIGEVTAIVDLQVVIVVDEIGVISADIPEVIIADTVTWAEVMAVVTTTAGADIKAGVGNTSLVAVDMDIALTLDMGQGISLDTGLDVVSAIPRDASTQVLHRVDCALQGDLAMDHERHINPSLVADSLVAG
jgi:hypothetical protein